MSDNKKKLEKEYDALMVKKKKREAEEREREKLRELKSKIRAEKYYKTVRAIKIIRKTAKGVGGTLKESGKFVSRGLRKLATQPKKVQQRTIKEIHYVGKGKKRRKIIKYRQQPTANKQVAKGKSFDEIMKDIDKAVNSVAY